MYEQLRQEAANRDGMITKEDKAQEKAADIERMKRRLFESNKSTDPRLVSGHSAFRVSAKAKTVRTLASMVAADSACCPAPLKPCVFRQTKHFQTASRRFALCTASLEST